jgi:hypothetical protein
MNTLFALGCGTDSIIEKKIPINSLVKLKYFYMQQMTFQHLMLIVYCVGKL